MDVEHPTIYVYLENEGVDVWRPVLAEHLKADIYRIVSAAEDSEDEQWQFKTGEVVRCESSVLSGSEASLVAVERVSATI